jgi:hypothetical protein
VTGGIDVRRLLVNTVLVVGALAFGLAIAFGAHLVTDHDDTPSTARANVRGSLARALANQGGVSEAAESAAPVAALPAAETPSPPAPAPDEAVRRFLELEIARDFGGSYGLLSAPDRIRESSRATWTTDHADLPVVTGSQIDGVHVDGNRADVSARLTLRAELTPGRALVPSRASATFATVAEDGGWRVAFGDTTVVPQYPPPASVPAAVQEWARERRACRTAPEYVAGLVGAAARADALCGTHGPIRTGRVRDLPETAQDQPFLAAFGSEVHDWARVVPVVGPVRMDVVVAPLGERWLVVGVLQAPSERS